MTAVESFLDNLKEEMPKFIEAIDQDALAEARNLIVEAKNNHGRVHVTGIGKPSHVSHYMASLFSSTGTPAYFLDGTEAVHGSAGQVLPGDVVIAISNSGGTEELKKSVKTLKQNGAKTIAVTGKADSWLATNTDVFLFAGVDKEGDSLNKPPRASILAEIIVLQCLSVLLQEECELDEQTYYKWHPGGALGASIENKMVGGVK